MTVRVGTRSSRLALWQATRVARALMAAWPGLEISVVEMSTHGDEVDQALPDIGGEGVFTERIERALRDGDVDIAVHSLKDLPVESRPDLLIGAILDREEVRETLITRSGVPLAGLPPGAVVGSSSTRRTAQLLALRPDLIVRPIRGNVETRIAKVDSGHYDATLLAGAGLLRLGLADRVSEWLPISDFLPAPGQGALAVQCRRADLSVIRLLGAIDDPALHAATDAERRFLGLLGCGCSAPVAAFAEVESAAASGGLGTIHMRTRISAPDGSRCIDIQGSGSDPEALALDLVEKARKAGADALLASATTAASTRRSLAGMRVLVTRALEQAESLCALLSARGAEPVVVPMIRITPLSLSSEIREAVKSLGSYDWIIFTSPNSVDAFLRAARDAAGSAELNLSGLDVAAVGPSTAEALLRWGVTPSLVPAAHDAAALAVGIAAAASHGISGAKVLYPCAERAREEAPELLRSRGAIVHDIAVYRTEPVRREGRELARLLGGRIDAILFLSGSAVDAFCDATRDSQLFAKVARDALIAVIGHTTAEAARARGLPIHVLPDVHTAESLVDALARYVETHTEAAP